MPCCMSVPASSRNFLIAHLWIFPQVPVKVDLREPLSFVLTQGRCRWFEGAASCRASTPDGCPSWLASFLLDHSPMHRAGIRTGCNQLRVVCQGGGECGLAAGDARSGRLLCTLSHPAAAHSSCSWWILPPATGMT